MKQWILVICLGLALLLVIGWTMDAAADLAEARQEQLQQSATQPAHILQTEPQPTQPPATEASTEPPTETTAPYVLFFTEEEEELLLKIGMAERGNAGCTECIALVMRTVLNRVEGPKFSSTIRGVIYAQDQFTPVADGTFDRAVPNERCREALDMICRGWDESQGALYYEWCDGESWHSRNLNLLLQHCDVRFYN